MTHHFAHLRLTVLALSASLALTLQGCGPTPAHVNPNGVNHHTRLDRAPLEPGQRPDAVTRLDLYKGTHRTRADQIITELYPASMEDVVASLPQSDCMWLAREAGQGEAIRMHWEMMGYVTDQMIDANNLTEEIRDVGLCRFNHYITRQPPRRHGVPENEYVDYTPSQAYGLGPKYLEFPGEGNFPRLTEDINVFWARLREFPTNEGPEPNACNPAADTNSGAELDITQGVRGYDGADVMPERWISACSGPFGRILFPEYDARFELWQTDLQGNLAHFHQLRPAIKMADSGETLARLTHPNGAQRAWATPVTGSSAVDVHWKENFTRRIQVESVRFFSLVGGAPDYLDVGSQRLCIDDPGTPGGCDWRCSAQAASDGSVFWMRADGSGAPGCRVGESLTGAPDLPAVTPTYRKVSLCDRRDAQCDPIVQPLNWSLDNVAGNPGDVFVEFSLLPVFEGMALRVAPTAANLGEIEIDEKAQTVFEVQNIGGVPIEIDLVSATTHPQSKADFAAHALGHAQAFPLPIRMTEDLTEIVFDSQTPLTLTMTEGNRHTLVRSTLVDGQDLTINQQSVSVDGGVIIRPAPNVSLVDPMLDSGEFPLRRMSYALRSIPFTLAPDERAEVLVNVTPRAYQGINGSNRHLGWLQVEASNVFDPGERQSAQIPVTVDALAGPRLQTFPPAISLPLDGSTQPGTQRASLVLMNFGDVGLDLLSFNLSGTNASYFSLHQVPSLPLHLAAGGSQLLEIDYQPNCDPLAVLGHRAVLTIQTSHQDYPVRLSGTPDCNLTLP